MEINQLIPQSTPLDSVVYTDYIRWLILLMMVVYICSELMLWLF